MQDLCPGFDDPPEGVTWRSYYSAGGARVAEREITHPTGGPVSQQVFYLIADHLGSTTVVTNQNGVEAGRNMYTAWGESRGTTGTLPTQRLYTGQLEAEAGLYFYGARFYDPSLGRFVNPDTILPEPGNPVAWDRYAYVNNNPVKYNDPSGHFAWLPVLTIGGALIGAGINYGSQVYNNYQSNGGDLGAALTQNIDLASVGESALAGAAIGLSVAVAAPVVVGLVGDALVGTGLLTGSTTLFSAGMSAYEGAAA